MIKNRDETKYIIYRFRVYVFQDIHIILNTFKKKKKKRDCKLFKTFINKLKNRNFEIETYLFNK